MKGRTNASEKKEAPKNKAVMVAGAKRSAGMYGGGMTMGTKGVARGMGAAVKGGNFTG